MDCFSDLRFYEDFENNFEGEGTTAVAILVPLSSLFESMTGKVENIGASFALKNPRRTRVSYARHYSHFRPDDSVWWGLCCAL